MSEKWTKGPWEIRKYKDPYGSRVMAVEILTDEIIVAKLGIELDDECKANAHLIAAAPDLYDALELIYGRLLMSDRDGGSRITAEDGEMAELALKKARGEL